MTLKNGEGNSFKMAIGNIDRDMVLRALKEFDRIGRDEMLKRYSSGPSGRSTKWYISYGGRQYDQKLILRAAHEMAGMGPLPTGKGTFTAYDARRHLENLGFEVIPV